MTAEEFSNAFDVLLGRAGETLDEYEKSLFLTQAQEELVLDLYSGKINSLLSFEDVEEARRKLHKLTKTEIIPCNGNKEVEVALDKKVWFITYETCKLDTGKEALVVPTRQDALYKTLENPFKGPSDRRVLRTDRNGTIQLISKYGIEEYTMDYLKKPNPIIVGYLEDLKIDELNTISECELDDSLHNEILNKAFIKALQAKALLTSKSK